MTSFPNILGIDPLTQLRQRGIQPVSLILVPRRGSGPYLLGPSAPRERFPSRALLEEGGRPYLDAAAIPHKCGAPCKRRFHREVHAISGPPFGRVDRLQQITDLWLADAKPRSIQHFNDVHARNPGGL